ncbi:unnamed protein product, partial [Ceratitis capitata]
ATTTTMEAREITQQVGHVRLSSTSQAPTYEQQLCKLQAIAKVKVAVSESTQRAPAKRA